MGVVCKNACYHVAADYVTACDHDCMKAYLSCVSQSGGNLLDIQNCITIASSAFSLTVELVTLGLQSGDAGWLSGPTKCQQDISIHRRSSNAC